MSAVLAWHYVAYLVPKDDLTLVLCQIKFHLISHPKIQHHVLPFLFFHSFLPSHYFLSLFKLYSIFLPFKDILSLFHVFHVIHNWRNRWFWTDFIPSHQVDQVKGAQSFMGNTQEFNSGMITVHVCVQELLVRLFLWVRKCGANQANSLYRNTQVESWLMYDFEIMAVLPGESKPHFPYCFANLILQSLMENRLYELLHPEMVSL